MEGEALSTRPMSPFVCDDGCARPRSRGVAAVDGDGIEQGIGAEVAGEHACAHRGPGFVYGQLQEFAQAREFGHVLFVGQEAGLEVTHMPARSCAFFSFTSTRYT